MAIKDIVIHRAGLEEQVYTALRGTIMRRELAPGQRLNVHELAAQFRVSRTPVKDALNRLATEGLVDIHPRRGTFVKAVTGRDMDEILDVRLMIELWAARRTVGRLSAEHLAEMRRNLQEQDELLEAEPFSYDRLLERDMAFHLMPIRWADNHHLMRMYKSIHSHLHIAKAYYVNALPRSRQAVIEHRNILRAYEARDLGAIEGALRTHLEAGHQGVRAALERHDGLL